MRSSKPIAKKGPWARGLTSLCRVDLQSWRLWWVVGGEVGRERTGMCVIWKVPPAGMGAAAHISYFIQGGQVPHLSTEGISCSTPTTRFHRGKTIARYTWTTLLYQVLSQVLFPLNLARARSEEGCSLSKGLSLSAPRSSSLPKAALEKLTLPTAVTWAASAPTKAEVLFSDRRAKHRLLPGAPLCHVFFRQNSVWSCD